MRVELLYCESMNVLELVIWDGDLHRTNSAYHLYLDSDHFWFDGKEFNSMTKRNFKFELVDAWEE